MKITWKLLTREQRAYARQLHEDEGWTMSEAIALAYAESAVAK
jgi:hypothetical protein